MQRGTRLYWLEECERDGPVHVELWAYQGCCSGTHTALSTVLTRHLV